MEVFVIVLDVSLNGIPFGRMRNQHSVLLAIVVSILLTQAADPSIENTDSIHQEAVTNHQEYINRLLQTGQSEYHILLQQDRIQPLLKLYHNHDETPPQIENNSKTTPNSTSIDVSTQPPENPFENITDIPFTSPQQVEQPTLQVEQLKQQVEHLEQQVQERKQEVQQLEQQVVQIQKHEAHNNQIRRLDFDTSAPGLFQQSGIDDQFKPSLFLAIDTPSSGGLEPEESTTYNNNMDHEFSASEFTPEVRFGNNVKNDAATDLLSEASSQRYSTTDNTRDPRSDFLSEVAPLDHRIRNNQDTGGDVRFYDTSSSSELYPNYYDNSRLYPPQENLPARQVRFEQPSAGYPEDPRYSYHRFRPYPKQPQSYRGARKIPSRERGHRELIGDAPSGYSQSGREPYFDQTWKNPWRSRGPRVIFPSDLVTFRDQNQEPDFLAGDANLQDLQETDTRDRGKLH